MCVWCVSVCMCVCVYVCVCACICVCVFWVYKVGKKKDRLIYDQGDYYEDNNALSINVVLEHAKEIE